MNHYIKEFPVLDQQVQNDISKYINSNKSDLLQSELYWSIQDKKFVDIDERSSKYKTFADKKLFDLVEKFISILNTKDDYYNYLLIKNNVTYIEYKAGDFFKPHEDYLSVTSNIIEEFTLLLCIDAECEGGETTFYFNKFFTYTSKASITKGSCILFRKDIKHGSNILERGHKKIITLNLWASPKQSNNLVVVLFNDNQKFILSYVIR